MSWTGGAEPAIPPALSPVVLLNAALFLMYCSDMEFTSGLSYARIFEEVTGDERIAQGQCSQPLQWLMSAMHGLGDVLLDIQWSKVKWKLSTNRSAHLQAWLRHLTQPWAVWQDGCDELHLRLVL